MKNNSIQNKFYWAYLVGIFIILALPLLIMPPWFFPPDWGKTIIFICFPIFIQKPDKSPKWHFDRPVTIPAKRDLVGK